MPLDHPVVSSLLPVVLLILVGVVTGKMKLIRQEAVRDLSNLVFLVLTQALLFRTMSSVHVQDLDFAPVSLYFAVAAGLFTVMLLLQGPSSRAAVIALSGTFSNTVMIGIPLVGLAYGKDALVLLFKSAAIVATPSTGAAAWCESNERLLLASFSDTASATTAYSGGTDALHTLAAAGYSYTAGMWHPRDYEWFDAAKLGYFLPLEPGSDNWRLKTYVGVTACNFTGTQYTNLIARRAALYYVLGGLSVDGGNGQVDRKSVV